MRFEHCYTMPICGPSRMVLLSGRQPYRTGFTLHHDAALYSGGGFDPRREVIFPRLFRDAGYVTGIAGKWQINNLYAEPDVLTRHGFMEQLVWPGSIDTDQVPPAEMAKFRDAVRRESVPDTGAFMPKIESRYWNPVFLRNGRREVLTGQFGPDVTQAFALDFLRRHRDRPFLFYYPLHLAHGPSFKEPVVTTPLNRDANRPHHAMYADMVRYADKLVGDLVRTLEELKLRDNTLVFVASDNGTESSLSARRNGRAAQGGLYTLTEAGGSVALLANCPKLIPGGRTVPLADFSDVLPTLCDLAGIALPRGVALDGKSCAAFLRGEAGAKPPREWIFNQLHTLRVVRDARFKLYSDGRFYDANADPEEKLPLPAGSSPEAAAAHGKLQRALASLPPDAAPPFPLRSQAMFKLREAERARQPVTNSIGLKLVRLPAGEFIMGSPLTEKGRRADEPQRHVRLTQDFFIGQFEVTRGQFSQFVEATGYKTDAERGLRGGYGYEEATRKLTGPDHRYSWRFTGFPQTDEHPVVNVSWNDATAFCRWLTEREQRTYRLPTEAEWEYACRGGTASAFANGNDAEKLAEVGNVVDALAKQWFPDRLAIAANDGHVFTAPVGSFKPNALGLHDLHGNVWEWTADWFGPPPTTAQTDPRGPESGKDKVVRGGDWYHDWSFARSAQRFPIFPGLCRRHAGFCVVREVGP